ncbi:hypothetical protein DSOUD_3267 [Desulfuromonas soudanensis]|uniref:Lipoprotein n=1 Tax=Desulfuromonas soudanensis TaxID=1603606 RepID=A0A0M4DKD8_9BACT|nr:hypothetical protein [Desulfuromonas soudanensis]ALC17987.1 hypothetical protein DSOUD_3267 [Desulfuromonas soudanensis]
MKKMVLLVMSVLALAACGVPKNATEFRQIIKGGGRFAVNRQVQIPRPFSAVWADIKARSEACFNVTVENTAIVYNTSGGPPYTYTAGGQLTQSGTGELIIRESTPGITLGSAPPGGLAYHLIADVRPLSTEAAEVTIYGMAGTDRLAKAILAFAAGDEQSSCPKFNGSYHYCPVNFECTSITY